MQVSIGPTALCVGVALFIFSFSFPPRGAKTRLRRVHYGPKIAVPSSAALSLRRSLCTLCNLAAPSTHLFSTRCRCSPRRAPSAAARAMCSDTCRRLEEAQGAGAGAGQQGEPVEQYGDALGLWLASARTDRLAPRATREPMRRMSLCVVVSSPPDDLRCYR